MAGLTLIKLGGSVLTDKAAHEALRSDVLERLSGELASGLPEACVVGHGSGSFGHRAAVAHGSADGVFPAEQSEAAAATRDAALRLHRVVFDSLRRAGIDVVSLPPAEWCRWEGDRLVVDARVVQSALQRGAVPLVMGDVVADAAGGARIAATEQVLVVLAEELPVERAVWVADTDGILDTDGVTLTSLDADAEPVLEGPQGADVTGGIALRWRCVRVLAQRGVESLLVNGLREGQLAAALAGEPGSGTQVRTVPRPA